MHFDTTVSLGNLITVAGLIFAGIWAWRDMTWRIGNLEEWRKEHMVDADARDRLLGTLSDILKHVKWQTEFIWAERLGRNPQPPP